MIDMNPRPPFMNGLLTARSILVSLKQRKNKENIEKFRLSYQGERQEVELISQKNEKVVTEQPALQHPEQPEFVNKLTKNEELSQKINNIGRELYQLYQETETYEIVFAKLVEHYQQNHKIVENNQHLKRKSYQLEQKIKHFKTKIKENYEKIEVNEKQGYEIQKLLQKQLEDFLIRERERAVVQPMQRLKTQKSVWFPKVNHQQEREDSSISINLNWRNLSQKTAKKPIARKPKASQDVRQNIFNSQIYNI